MIEVRLFGDLRRYATGATVNQEPPIYLSVGDDETVGRVLARMGIDLAEIGNLFLNGRLLPRSRYPILLGYPSTAESPLSPDGYLNTAIKAGDRVGIFPRNMAMVVV